MKQPHEVWEHGRFWDEDELRLELIRFRTKVNIYNLVEGREDRMQSLPFWCAGPCSRSLPLERRTGRAASREKNLPCPVVCTIAEKFGFACECS